MIPYDSITIIVLYITMVYYLYNQQGTYKVYNI